MSNTPSLRTHPILSASAAGTRGEKEIGGPEGTGSWTIVEGASGSAGSGLASRR